MKKIIFPIILNLVVLSVASAQFGVSAKFNANTWKTIDDFSQELTITEPSIEFGLNYWFRLKNYRVEFLPEVTFANYTNDLGLTFNAASIKRSYFGFQVNTLVYPLDFEGDCNCPTFSKQGDFFSKGFHWMVTSGVLFHQAEAIDIRDAIESKPVSSTVPRVGLGAGLDIGLQDIITISPFAVYNLDFSVAQPIEIYSSTNSMIETSHNMRRITFGLRLMFRPDYVKQNGGFRRR